MPDPSRYIIRPIIRQNSVFLTIQPSIPSQVIRFLLFLFFFFSIVSSDSPIGLLTELGPSAIAALAGRRQIEVWEWFL
jgi:hypothetical protein